MWLILDVMRMRNYKGTSQCIIKLKRMHRLNYLSFGE